jgi:hypothetical protein
MTDPHATPDRAADFNTLLPWKQLTALEALALYIWRFHGAPINRRQWAHIFGICADA